MIDSVAESTRCPGFLLVTMTVLSYSLTSSETSYLNPSASLVAGCGGSRGTAKARSVNLLNGRVSACLLVFVHAVRVWNTRGSRLREGRLTSPECSSSAQPKARKRKPLRSPNPHLPGM